MVNDLPTLAWAANLGDHRVPRAAVARRAAPQAARQPRPHGLRPRSRAKAPPSSSVVSWPSTSPTSWQKAGVESFAKTSGSKGLQLYAAARAQETWDALREQAHRDRPQSSRPSIATSSSPTCGSSLRQGRVLIDWSQNHPAKTTVGVYSVRAMPEPTPCRPGHQPPRCVPVSRKGTRILSASPTDEVLRRVEATRSLSSHRGPQGPTCCHAVVPPSDTF